MARITAELEPPNPDSPLLPVYLRDVGHNPTIARDRELELGHALHAARAATVRLAGKVKAAVFDLATAGWPEKHLKPESWTVREAAAFCDGVVRLSSFRPDVVAALRNREELQAAREALTRANLRLVVFVAKRYRRSSLPLLDMIQEGNLGLMRAVERYDSGVGTRFSTYACWWIKQAIVRAIVEKERLIRLPVEHHENMKLVEQVRRSLRQTLGRAPRDQEIADRLSWSVDKVRRFYALVSDPETLDQIERLEDHATLLPHQHLGHREVADAIHRALEQRLTPREITIIRLRFGLGAQRTHTLSEIGRVLRVSRERARQIEIIALSKLRECGALLEYGRCV